MTFILGAKAMTKLNEVDGKTQSLLEERAKDMTSKEVDFVWQQMEKGLPYISAEARTTATDMIKELKAISRRKHNEELALDG